MSEDSKPNSASEAEDDAPSSEGAEDAATDAASREKRRVRTRDDKPRALEADNGPPPPPPPPNYLFLVGMSVIFLALDLLSKEWAVRALEGPANKKIVVIDGFWAFDLAKNKGGAWGILGDQPDFVRLPFFFVISAVAVVFIVSLFRKLEKRQTALKWALPLVLGGAIGNLVDRVRHQHVIDFIDWHYKDNHWPTFNIADVWIVAGVILMGIDMFTPRTRLPRAAPAALRAKAKAAAPSGEEA